MEEDFNFWMILDIAIRLFAVLALIPIIASHYGNPIQPILILIFILWAFRPIWLAWRKFKHPKKKVKVNKKNRGAGKNKIWLVLRLSLILILIISPFLFIPGGNIFLNQINNSGTYSLSSEIIYNPDSWRDNINKLVGIPFDLNYYHFCVKDLSDTESIGGYLSNFNSSLEGSVRINGELESLNINGGGINCTSKSFSSEDKVSFQFNLHQEFTLSYGVSPENSKIIIGKDIYAKPNSKTLIMKRIIFFFSLSAILIIILELIKFLNIKQQK